MNIIKKFLINHFSFSPVEVRGFFVLMFLLIFFTFFPFVWERLSPKPSYDKSADQAMLDSLLATMQTYDKPKPKVNFASTTSSKHKSLFKFNPNTATENELIDLGIKSYLAARIVKYRSKGGKFYKKEDLLKIYGFPKALYTELDPYIEIPEQRKKGIAYQNSTDKDGNKLETSTESREGIEEKTTITKPQKFNLNTADTTQLKRVYGIGTTLANRIVKFRDKLGGFNNAEQLQEVYGLKPEISAKLLEIAEIPQETPITKLKVNQLDEKGLQQHPYISWKEAKFIVKYRNQHGPYKSIEGIADIKVFDEAFIKKIAPYLSYE